MEIDRTEKYERTVGIPDDAAFLLSTYASNKGWLTLTVLTLPDLKPVGQWHEVTDSLKGLTFAAEQILRLLRDAVYTFPARYPKCWPREFTLLP